MARNGVAEVDLDFTPADNADAFKDYEKSSNGLVKFFRIARHKLNAFFGSEPEQPDLGYVTPRVIGQVENDIPTVMCAVAEIMAHAMPVSLSGINRQALEPVGTSESPESIVAVVNGQIIPDVHMLESQLKHANDQHNSVGMARFMERVAAVADKRKHSVNDLMKFMRRGDLPVAEDGCLIIYKVLSKNKWLKEYPDHTFVDLHSGNVPQRIGSHVFMREGMVDPNRRNECSNGLHVARRGYIRSFSGDVITICKVAPEDVIAVPHDDANKMRVCGYHILFQLSSEDHEQLRMDKPLTSADGMQKLSDAISGNHPPAMEEVEITASRGGGIKIHPLNKLNPVKPTKPVKVIAAILEPSAEAAPVKHIDVKSLAAEVQEIQTTGKSRMEAANDLFLDFKKAKTSCDKKAAATVLIAFKKSKKVGWAKLGICADDANKVEAAVQ